MQSQVDEAVRRMIFNVVAHNRDDHVKNFAFLMAPAGTWRLSPAYDLACAAGPGGEHTMTLDGEGREPTLAGILGLANRHDLTRARTLEIVERVNEAVARWPTLARQSGGSRQRAAQIESSHRFLTPPRTPPTRKRSRRPH